MKVCQLLTTLIVFMFSDCQITNNIRRESIKPRITSKMYLGRMRPFLNSFFHKSPFFKHRFKRPRKPYPSIAPPKWPPFNGYAIESYNEIQSYTTGNQHASFPVPPPEQMKAPEPTNQLHENYELDKPNLQNENHGFGTSNQLHDYQGYKKPNQPHETHGFGRPKPPHKNHGFRKPNQFNENQGFGKPNQFNKNHIFGKPNKFNKNQGFGKPNQFNENHIFRKPNQFNENHGFGKPNPLHETNGFGQPHPSFENGFGNLKPQSIINIQQPENEFNEIKNLINTDPYVKDSEEFPTKSKIPILKPRPIVPAKTPFIKLPLPPLFHFQAKPQSLDLSKTPPKASFTPHQQHIEENQIFKLRPMKVANPSHTQKFQTKFQGSGVINSNKTSDIQVVSDFSNSHHSDEEIIQQKPLPQEHNLQSIAYNDLFHPQPHLDPNLEVMKNQIENLSSIPVKDLADIFLSDAVPNNKHKHSSVDVPKVNAGVLPLIHELPQGHYLNFPPYVHSQ